MYISVCMYTHTYMHT